MLFFASLAAWREIPLDRQAIGIGGENPVSVHISIKLKYELTPDFPGSVGDLREKLLNFIEYFNRVFAKPFRWTYTGRPLMKPAA
ncbi:hypothetical protein BH23PLA1_BH23PLA1_27360 [soil metagenome]